MLKVLFLVLGLSTCTGRVSLPNSPVILLDDKNTKGCLVGRDYPWQEFYLIELEDGTLVTVSRIGFVRLDGFCKVREDLKL